MDKGTAEKAQGWGGDVQGRSGGHMQVGSTGHVGGTAGAMFVLHGEGHLRQQAWVHVDTAALPPESAAQHG